jgi:hypothetical protein
MVLLNDDDDDGGGGCFDRINENPCQLKKLGHSM